MRSSLCLQPRNPILAETHGLLTRCERANGWGRVVVRLLSGWERLALLLGLRTTIAAPVCLSG